MILWLLILFAGESLSIYGELVAARGRPWLGGVVGSVGWPLLILGYWLGCRQTSAIWKVTAASIGSILIAEPLLILLVFREAPSRNELVGCLLGAAGLIVANWKA